MISPQHQIEILAGLRREINALNNMVLYYQNRALQKQKALESLVESWEVEEHLPVQQLEEMAPRPSIPAMIRSVMNGDALLPREIFDLVRKQYPGVPKTKYFYSTLWTLREGGFLVKDGKRYRKCHTPSNTAQ